MAPQQQTTASPTPPQKGENSLGLKAFNRTGQEDTTTKVLRPVGAPKSRGRNFVLMAIVVVAVVVMLSFAYQRSGLSLIPEADTKGSFGNSNTAGPTEESGRGE